MLAEYVNKKVSPAHSKMQLRALGSSSGTPNRST